MSEDKSKRVFILGAGVGTCMDISVQNGLFEAIMKFDYSTIGENHYDFNSDKEAINHFLSLKQMEQYPGIEKVLECIHKARFDNEESAEIKEAYDTAYLDRYFNLYNMLYDYLWNQIRNGGKEARPDGIIPRESIDLFAKRLKLDDIIINFNYDVAIENRLDILEKLWTYGNRKGVKIFKVHGSINWVEIDRDEEISYRSSKTSPPISAKAKEWFEPLTECTEKYWVVKSPEGGRLLTTYFDLTTVKVTKYKKQPTPLIIPPMKEKDAYKDLNVNPHFFKIINNIRNCAWKAIEEAKKLYIIGYSFNCDQDSKSVKEIFERIEKNNALKIFVVNPSVDDIISELKECKTVPEVCEILRKIEKVPKSFEKWVREDFREAS